MQHPDVTVSAAPSNILIVSPDALDDIQISDDQGGPVGQEMVASSFAAATRMHSIENLDRNSIGSVSDNGSIDRIRTSVRSFFRRSKQDSISGFDNIDEHLLSMEELQLRFAESGIDKSDPSHSTGLPSICVDIRLHAQGLNILTPPKTTPLWVLIGREFLNPFMLLLLEAGVLSLISYGIDTSQSINLYLGLILFGLVVGCSVSAFKQQHSTSKMMLNTLQKMLPQSCVVVRNGRKLQIDASKIVIGDVVNIQMGDKVPADLRLIQCSDLRIECSHITGESTPILCNALPSPENTPSNEAQNLALSGSLVQGGSAFGVVINTGDKSVVGQIASQVSRTEEGTTTLRYELGRFAKFITVLSLLMGSVFFIIGVGRKHGQGVLHVLINGFLVIIVANVPQGLPVIVSALLNIVAHRLAKANIFVKKLDAIETLGSASMILCDKTGTLTQNTMTVTAIWIEEEFLWDQYEDHIVSSHFRYRNRQDDAGLRSRARKDNRSQAPTTITPATITPTTITPTPTSEKLYNMASRLDADGKLARPLFATNGIQQLYIAACVCNNSKFTGPEPPIDWSSRTALHHRANTLDLIGSSSDVALLRWCENALPSGPTRDVYEVVFEIPFVPENKFHLVICAAKPIQSGEVNREYTLFAKGAPEVIVSRCSSFWSRSQNEQPIDGIFQRDFESACHRFGMSGYRVLGVCKRSFVAASSIVFSAQKKNYPFEDLCFLGVAAITDPPRQDAAEAVSKCQSAGIRVAMVTGDHRLTACSVARQVNILPPNAIESRFEEEDETLELLGRGLSPCVAMYREMDWACVEGADIDTLTALDWDELLTKKSLVFARVTPNHKLKIVVESQLRGEIVVVTGDGINDGPALKKAHVGIALSMKGSDVAREASDILLMDDNFASIVMVIEQGRLIFDNLVKVFAYTLTHLMPEIVPVLLTLALGMPTGLSSLQILSIDLGTELGPAISLAYEEKESDIMHHPPRNKNKDKLATPALLFYSYILLGFLISLSGLVAYLLVFYSHGIYPSDLVLAADNHFDYGVEPFCVVDRRHDTPQFLCFSDVEQVDIAREAASGWLVALVVSQFFHIWTVKCRRVSLWSHGFSNHVTMFGVALELCILLLEVYIPEVQGIFNTAPVGYVPWIVGVISGIAVLCINETRKHYVRTAKNKNGILARLFW